jgi:hypothetical protein
MFRRLVVVAAACTVAACSNDVQTVGSATDTPTAVSLDALTLQAGDSLVPAAQVTVDGVLRDATAGEVRYASSDTTVIAVAPTGALVARTDGSVEITATVVAAPAVTVTQQVSVNSDSLTRVNLIAPLTMIPGDTASYVVTGTTRAGRVLSSPVRVTVSSRNPSVVRAAGNVAIAVAPGQTWIVARASNGVSDSSFVTVAVGTPTAVVMAPRTATVTAGQTLHTDLGATDRRGNVVTSFAASYTSLSTTVATVTSDGTVLARAAGSALIIASAGTGADTLRLTVTPAAVVLTRLVLIPDTLTLAPGDSARVAVQAVDNAGNAMPTPALTWQSQITGVTASSTGMIHAASSITSTISNGTVVVTSGTVTAYLHVSVVYSGGTAPVDTLPTTPISDGYVQIRWVGATPSTAVAAAFEAARVKINGLFLSYTGVAPANTNLGAGYCMSGAPALNETVKGIIIFAQVSPIDGVGQILGSAGPCIIRNATFLPIVASMQFDSADMDAMVASGMLNGVVLHEMMHTLGFGTIWGPGLQNQVALPSGADPRYLGTRGEAAYAALGGSDAATGVPVENTGASGTRGAHWRESTFRSELMTGWADGSMAMSRMTVSALKDFGYDVDVNKADAYALPGALIAGASTNSQQIGETTFRPIGILGKNGTITPISGQ